MNHAERGNELGAGGGVGNIVTGDERGDRHKIDCSAEEYGHFAASD